MVFFPRCTLNILLEVINLRPLVHDLNKTFLQVQMHSGGIVLLSNAGHKEYVHCRKYVDKEKY